MQQQVMLMGHGFDATAQRSQLRASMMSMATEPDLSVSTVASNHCKGIRFRARVLYDGEDFSGMQIQPHGHSVANVLEIALRQRMGCSSIRVCAASRTDTGVHARGQAIHFDLPSPAHANAMAEARRPNQHRQLPAPEELERSLNALLPPSVRVAEVELAPEVDDIGRPWHARLSAAGKLYSYYLCVDRLLDPLARRQRLHVPRPLNYEAMRRALPYLNGLVDCAALANRRAGESSPLTSPPSMTMRVIRAIDVVEEAHLSDGYVRIDFHLKSALYKMVRNLVGLLLSVGMGQIAPDEIPGLLAARDRSRLPPPAPAHGLTLECVYYRAGWNGKYTNPLHTETLCESPKGGDDECRL